MSTVPILSMVITPLLNAVFGNLATYGRSFLSGLLRRQKDLEKLQMSIELARHVLGDAEEQRANDTEVINSLKRLKKAIYKAENVLIDYANSRPPTPEELKRLLSDLETAVDDVLPLSKIDPSADRKIREKSHIVTPCEIYGRNEDKDNIVRLLLRGLSEAPSEGGDPVPCVTIEGSSGTSEAPNQGGDPVPCVTIEGSSTSEAPTQGGDPVPCVTFEGSSGTSEAPTQGGDPVPRVTIEGSSSTSEAPNEGGDPVPRVTIEGSSTSEAPTQGGDPVPFVTIEGSSGTSEAPTQGGDPVPFVTIEGSSGSSEAPTQGGDPVPCVIIEGMTAIGKTTLAQLVYNDEKVERYFQEEDKIWVFVSHHSDARKILVDVIKSGENAQSPPSSDDFSSLHSAIKSLLKKRRRLIVLDDVCIEETVDWENLSPLFQSANGSRVLITTQNKRVAEEIVKVSQQSLRYNLKGLSEDQCYDVLKHHAFKGEKITYPRLEEIGKEIARKCGGVALAAKSLGSLLHSERNEGEWSKILDNELWTLNKRERGILQTMRLSYSRLPLCLRRCLAFCSIFPRGCEINKEKLIHLWMAGGLISYDNKAKRSSQAEDTGGEYFHDLLCRSLFEEENQSDDGAVVGYKMRDAIYNLARFVSKSEYAILDHNVPVNDIDFSGIRHSSLFCASTIPVEIYEARDLLTLFSRGDFHTVPENVFTKFGYLLVLNLSGSGVRNLDGSSLSKLVHLRLLDLSYTLIEALPPEIKHLHFLHTLNLFHCYNLQQLNLEYMEQVKHLNNAGCKTLEKMIDVENIHFGWSLTLERLPLFVIFWPDDIGLLEPLHLRGNLKITRLRKVPKGSFPAGHDHQFLKNMDKLESLGLFWEDDDYRPNINPDEESVVRELGERKQTTSSGSLSGQADQEVSSWAKKLLSCLCPPAYLKRLVISGYPGTEFPWLTVPRFLNVFHLIGWRNIQRLPVLGDLQSLNSLLLQGMNALMCLKGEFPKLRKLIISNCQCLIEFPAKDLKSIRHLELHQCKATLVHSFQGLTSLETLVIEEVNDLDKFSPPFPGNNPHLTSLEIKSCSELLGLPEEVKNCTSLQSLTIRQCEKLTNLPACLYKLTALKSLEISNCSLESLPTIMAGGFSNLRSFTIKGCAELTSLPERFECLTSLQYLSIQGCPELIERCKPNGEDWPKIDRVPHKNIGG